MGYECRGIVDLIYYSCCLQCLLKLHNRLLSGHLDLTCKYFGIFWNWDNGWVGGGGGQFERFVKQVCVHLRFIWYENERSTPIPGQGRAPGFQTRSLAGVCLFGCCFSCSYFRLPLASITVSIEGLWLGFRF